MLELGQRSEINQLIQIHDNFLFFFIILKFIASGYEYFLFCFFIHKIVMLTIKRQIRRKEKQ